MVRISVSQSDVRAVQAKIRGMPEKVVGKAFRHSANRAIKSGATFAVREIGKELKLDRDKIRDNIRVSAITGKIDVRDMRAEMAFAGKPLPLSYFNPVQEKGGVRVTIKKASKLIRGAFIATVRAGATGSHLGVFMRARMVKKGGQSRRVRIVLKSGMRSNKELPISQRFTTSLAQMASNLSINRAIKARTLEIFAKNFTRDLDYYMSKFK